MVLAARFRNVIYALIGSIFIIALVMPLAATAATVTNGSLLLGDPRPSQTSTYTFSGQGFTTGTNIGCVELVFNTQADGAGSVPAGMTTTSSTYDSATLVGGGWAVANPANGTVRITNGTPATPNATGNVVWGGITNSSSEATYYGIFTTYTDNTCATSVDNGLVAFVVVDGELVQLTIDPTLTFAVNTVGSGLPVNTVNTTVASTAGTINFGNSVTSAANGVSAHDVQVGTNAPNGYTVYIRHTGQLTNGASDTIDNWTGTNAAPTSIAGVGTELWAYTTEDSSLSGGTANRFTNGGPFWAGFTTTNQPVMDNPSAPASTETVRVGHQVGVASTTEAGTYTTTIIYTAASVY